MNRPLWHVSLDTAWCGRSTRTAWIITPGAALIGCPAPQLATTQPTEQDKEPSKRTCTTHDAAGLVNVGVLAHCWKNGCGGGATQCNMPMLHNYGKRSAPRSPPATPPAGALSQRWRWAPESGTHAGECAKIARGISERTGQDCICHLTGKGWRASLQPTPPNETTESQLPPGSRPSQRATHPSNWAQQRPIVPSRDQTIRWACSR